MYYTIFVFVWPNAYFKGQTKGTIILGSPTSPILIFKQNALVRHIFSAQTKPFYEISCTREKYFQKIV